MSQTPTRNRSSESDDQPRRPSQEAVAPAPARLRAQVGPTLQHGWAAARRLTERVGLALAAAAVATGRAIVRGLDRLEAWVVPALVALWRALLRAVDRVEGVVVPAFQGLVRWFADLVERGERGAIPVVHAGASTAARGVVRGEERLVAAVAAGGRTLARGVQGAESRVLGSASGGTGTAVLAPPGGGGPDGDDLGPLDLFDDPDADHPLPTAGTVAAARLLGTGLRREDARRLGRSLLANSSGLIVTGVLVVVATTLVAQAVWPTAAAQTTQSVSAELILPDDVLLSDLEEPSTIFAGDSTPLATLDQEIDRNVVDLPAIPLYVQQAIITAEDRKFYEHDGYDAEGIGRALLANYEAGSLTQGGSTITQQLAKSIIGADRTIERKVEELVYAVALEERFEKDELLEQYLNQVFFGRNAYGIDAAAQKYFNIPQEQLTLEQAALLAAMIRSPNNANPDVRPELATRRRNAVIDAMVQEGYLPAADAEAAKLRPLGVVPVVRDPIQLPFVVDAVREEFLNSPEFAAFGANRQEREHALFFGGLQIHSSLDRRLQDVAQQVLAANFTGDPAKVTGALVSVEPATGRILAATGALRYEDEAFNLATQGRRQAGSTYKPFVYAAALEAGLSVRTPLSGRSPTYFDNIPGWTRRDGGLVNYGNRSYGQLDMRSALVNSVNTATVQLGQIIGTQRVVDLTAAMGVDAATATGGKIVDSVLLGGLDNGVTPVEMASAYGTFANGGIHVRAHLIDRIVDRNGNEVYRGQPPGTQVLQPQVNATMVALMQDVVNRGTGTRAAIRGWPVAGKTGTTNNNVDAWFVGYTPTLSTAMWYGYEQGQISTGQTGGQRPAMIWNQYMTRALEGVQPVPWPEVEQGSGRIAPGQPTTVPDLRRLPSTDALRLLIDAKLTADIRTAPSEARAGTVLSQSPAAGTPALSGDTVRVTVSSGQPPAPSPTPTPRPQPSQPGSGGEQSPAPQPAPGTPGGGPSGPRPPGVINPPAPGTGTDAGRGPSEPTQNPSGQG